MHRSRRKRRTRRSRVNQPGRGLAAYWSLKVLIDLEGWRHLDYSGFSSSGYEALCRLIGLGSVSEASEAFSRKDFLRLLEKRQRELNSVPQERNDVIAENIERLGTLVGLNGLEQSILAVAILLRLHSGFETAVEALGDFSRGSLIKVLAVILDAPERDVQEALIVHGVLFRSGLLRLNGYHPGLSLESHLEIMDSLVESLTLPQTDPVDMLRQFFHPAAAPTLEEADFRHLGNRYQTLRRYIAQSVKRKSAGANVLLYGRPGTGKTQLARTLARRLECILYEVAFADLEGTPMKGDDRFSVYQLCQQTLSRQRKTLVLFDEIEDVFQNPFPLGFRMGSTDGRHKAWVNWILEENPVPAIWICNDIDQLSHAFIRRFDMVLEMEHPPLKTRARILRQHLDGMPISRAWIERTAQNPDIAPAVVARAAKVVEAVGKKTEKTAESALEDVLSGTLKAMGYPQPVNRVSSSPIAYRLDALNPDQDLGRILRGLKRHPHGRICLYGPPGTGKTEFGHYLSRQLEIPLLQKRASDLLSPFVGETEQQIASMFKQAETDGAVLMLDEADSFLRDRTGAHQSWEVTRVNELLTQMEAYEGIFLCSTNLVESLDKASLRRFDLKIHFGYLKPEQAWVLFKQIVGGKKLRREDERYWRDRLAQLEELTPGDFAVVVRRRRMMGVGCDAEGVMAELEEEGAFKRGGRGRGIGFSATI